MLDIKLAKSKMENEEGMNHLWIRIASFSSENLKHAQVTIRLPDNIYRLENLNGYFEDENGSILLGSVLHEQDIMIEIYTQDEVPCGESKITVSLSYRDNQDQTKEILRSIPLRLVTENEMDNVEIDEEVISRLKKRNESHIEEKFVEFPLQTQYVSNELSSLEKKYRVDCTFY
ncbi:hypothetical protein [Aneurinibacillus aneurinilyticus]|uniref:Uncharacterized protein n=1 Tax=Aneurinibacillus aneurinilyticus TaxID=1391 RepID=A0A848D597_ANEAE|nr:hypothetical protein [Aneurinibacillus aneurinilyticus]NMF00851.1 hypothetical protein [Aneurinibacillus aneurinilyticus]